MDWPAHARPLSGHGTYDPGMTTSAERTVRTYYDALRAGDPLGPFFAGDESVVKVGISERLVGGDAVADGLRNQTDRTADWTVTSSDLRVADVGCHAWFSDTVRLAWTDTATGTRHDHETRWSGTLAERDGWVFVGMHVSTATEFRAAGDR